jgi:hypothetical protein
MVAVSQFRSVDRGDRKGGKILPFIGRMLPHIAVCAGKMLHYYPRVMQEKLGRIGIAPPSTRGKLPVSSKILST